MFRSKRNSLVKRLWKQRIIHQLSDDEASCTMENHQDLEMKSVLSVLKRLKEPQLETLLKAVESLGAEISGCVLLPCGDLRLSRGTVPLHVIFCQLWRWPDVWRPFELKRLHWCHTVNGSLYTCCNPFHWSRLCTPDSPPPPYCRFSQELLKPEDRAPSELVFPEIGGTNQYGYYCSHPSEGSVGGFSSQHSWCTLAYWEFRSRVGRLFPVHEKTINVFHDLPHGDGLCLNALTGAEGSQMENVLRTRQKIGLGITLTREKDGVWMYNRSQYPVFVNSPTLDLSNIQPLTVCKASPGYSVKIFDYEKSKCYQCLEKSDPSNGPFNHNAVCISFVKGWGTKYSRRCITACPCWLEILFSVVR